MRTTIKFQLIFLIICVFILPGCKKDSWCNCFENTGSETSEIRQIEPFHSIEMDNNVDIVLKSGLVTELKVTCGKNLVDGIKTEVRDGILYVKNINKCNWVRDFKNKFVVEVTYTQLNFITNRGSGNLSCADTLKGASFQVDSWNGTGTLNLVLDCNEVFLKLHTGPADIIASGKAGVMYLYAAGNGFIKAAAVKSDYTYVTNKSTGDCEVTASKELDAIINYNGDVYYSGNPALVTSTVTGSGKLIPF